MASLLEAAGSKEEEEKRNERERRRGGIYRIWIVKVMQINKREGVLGKSREAWCPSLDQS